jgi:hypothetical protein
LTKDRFFAILKISALLQPCCAQHIASFAQHPISRMFSVIPTPAGSEKPVHDLFDLFRLMSLLQAFAATLKAFAFLFRSR